MIKFTSGLFSCPETGEGCMQMWGTYRSRFHIKHEHSLKQNDVFLDVFVLKAYFRNFGGAFMKTYICNKRRWETYIARYP